eukprot:11222361-Lingulodinium_polyedra.AAC.1
MGQCPETGWMSGTMGTVAPLTGRGDPGMTRAEAWYAGPGPKRTAPAFANGGAFNPTGSQGAAVVPAPREE